MTLAATTYALLAGFAVAFQLGLAAGRPWGHLAMGGRYPGQFPPPLRIGAVVQALVLALLAIGVLAKADLVGVLSTQASWLAWVAVTVSAVSLVMNLATPSAAERRLWAPVGAAMVASSLVVALG